MAKTCIICEKEIKNTNIICPFCGEFNSFTNRNYEDCNDEELFKAMNNSETIKKNIL